MATASPTEKQVSSSSAFKISAFSVVYPANCLICSRACIALVLHFAHAILFMQLLYLRQLGCTVTPTSKLHASKLIEQYKAM